MEKLKKAEALLLGLESALLALILTSLVVLSFGQVFLRQFFSAGLLWGDTLGRHLVLWVGFLGAAIAAAEEKHFAFETLASHLPSRLRKAAAVLTRLVAVTVALLLAKAAWDFMLDEKTAALALFRVGEFAAPRWIFASIVPLGFFLVALHTALRGILPAPERKGSRL